MSQRAQRGLTQKEIAERRRAWAVKTLGAKWGNEWADLEVMRGEALDRLRYCEHPTEVMMAAIKAGTFEEAAERVRQVCDAEELPVACEVLDMWWESSRSDHARRVRAAEMEYRVRHQWEDE